FDLPLLEPIGVSREQGTVQLYASDDYEVNVSDDQVESAQPAAVNRGAQQQPAARAAWHFNHRPVRIPVTVGRKPTRLSAQVATDIAVQPTRTRVTTTVDFLVEYAGQDRFRIDVPETALPTLQIEALAGEAASAVLRETAVAEPEDGWVRH